MIAVADVVRQALPPGTSVVAGEAGLGREVTWATRLRPTPPAFAHLDAGELVLIPPDVLELLDERLTLAEAVRQLSGFGVSAVAFAGRSTTAARQAADELGMPLLRLPTGADFGMLERETARFIAERRRELQRRGQEVGRQLMELAIGGESLGALAHDLVGLAGRAVAIEGRDHHVLAFETPHDAGPAPDEVETLVSINEVQISGWLRSVAGTNLAEPPTAAYALNDRWLRVVAPVSGRDGLLGSLSLFVPRDGETIEDSLIASRGAAACAVTLAREQAAAGARREVELNVLDEILDGALRSEVSLLQQTRRLGHDLNEPHCALIARLDPAPGTPARAREGRWGLLDEALSRAAAKHQTRILWRMRNNSAEIVWPTPDGLDLKLLGNEIQEDLAARIASTTAHELVSVGVGRARGGLDGIRRSHQEARQALTLGRRLRGPGHLTTFDGLGVYRLIYAAES
ncbi:MAG: PucR family transcriptional regulator ligand-binding domain-containing protein, partial [Chloroflexia bacterium]|nr:PucR family transcriptional regulator ligand-binding domain-containing protein [Chloroflexia bacterium]